MRKILIMFIIFIQIFTFTSCNKSDTKQSSKAETTTVSDKDFTQEPHRSSVANTTKPDESADSHETPDSKEDYLENISYVSDTLHSVVISNEFQKGDLDTRVQLLTAVLEQLLEKGCIEDYQFSLTEERPNVYFDYAGGGGGAVALKDFPKDQN